MVKPKSTFSKNMQIEDEISEWLHAHYYSTDLFEKAEKINTMDLQHKGVDVHQTSYKIFKDRKAHAVDEKCAMTYVKKSHDEKPLQTFAFELDYFKGNQLKEGWLFGDKYTNTEYYQLMWIWADVSKKGNHYYNWKEINQTNITKVKGYLIKKTVIQDYLMGIGVEESKLATYRAKLKKGSPDLHLGDGFSRIKVSHHLGEKPMNVIVRSEKLKELATYHFEQEVTKEEADKVYSKTRMVASSVPDSRLVDEIVSDIKAGIKTIVFSQNPESLHQNIQGMFSPSEQEYLEQSILLEVNLLPDDLNISQNQEYDNGDLDLKDWRYKIKTYNWDQYEVEHADYQKNIAVKAGAGTGKTRTMVQRMLYLILYKNFSLDEIGLITFTNDATKEMKERIKEVVFARYKVTQSIRYLDLLEELNQLNIATIDSFSRTFIKEYDYKLGLGKKTPITSYISRKKEIISSVINRAYKEQVRTLLAENHLQHYELVGEILRLWDKVLSLGIEIPEFADYTIYNERDALLRKIIIDSYEILTAEKRKEGVIDLSDLKFLSKRIIKNLTKEDLRHSKLNYLFVDEFQDTDNIQIDYISAIHETLGTTLFIVGDDKQSIYRFRGAQHTAFETIREKILFKDASLSINYRTQESLLLSMNQFFERFKHLPDSKPLKPHIKGGVQEVQLVNYEQKDFEKNTAEYAEIFINRVNEEEQKMSDNSSLAILCRTNNEVNKLAKILDENGYKGKYLSSKSGSLYQRAAAKDLAKFINLLLNPKNSAYHLAAIETPYFYKNQSATENLAKLDEHNTVLDSEDYEELEALIEKQKFKPFLSILREVLIQTDNNERAFDRNLYRRYIQQSLGEADEFQAYRENYHNELNLIIERIGQSFGSQSYAAVDISEWLDIQINTNKIDDIPIEHDLKRKIILTTIHKAKGLEYESVIIPVTHHPIWMHKVGFYVNYDEKVFVSNLNKYETDKNLENKRINETLELLQEESRVLYVAMTRAKKSLTLFKPKKVRNNSFAGLLEGKG